MTPQERRTECRGIGTSHPEPPSESKRKWHHRKRSWPEEAAASRTGLQAHTHRPGIPCPAPGAAGREVRAVSGEAEGVEPGQEDRQLFPETSL